MSASGSKCASGLDSENQNYGPQPFRGCWKGLEFDTLDICTVNPRKLEHGFRRIGTRIPYTLA